MRCNLDCFNCVHNDCINTGNSSQKYYAKNRAKMIAYHKEYYTKNRDNFKNYNKKYYQENKAKILAHQRVYRQNKRIKKGVTL